LFRLGVSGKPGQRGGSAQPLLKANTGAAAFTSTQAHNPANGRLRTNRPVPDTFGSLLSPEDVADIKAGDIPVAALHAYVLSFAENIRIGRVAPM